MDRLRLGRSVRALRIEAGWRQVDLAARSACSKQGDQPIHQRGVRLVEQAVQALAPPSNTDVEVGAKGGADALDSVDVSMPHVTALDLRDIRARASGPLRQVELTPAVPNTDRAN